jgi:hypothetical protein
MHTQMHLSAAKWISRELLHAIEMMNDVPVAPAISVRFAAWWQTKSIDPRSGPSFAKRSKD